MRPSAGQLDRGDARELDLAGAREAGAVPREREPDAARRSLPVRAQRTGRDRARPGAPAPRVGGPRAQSRELGGLGGPLQDLLGGHARAQDLAGRGRVARDVDVASADVQGRDPELLGDPVEVRLGRELGLRRPEAAERAVGRRVGPGRPRPDPDVRAAIRTTRVERAARQHDRRERAVRAAVHHDLDVLGDEHALAGDAGAVADDRRVALGRRRDVLVAVVDHADRLLGLAREQRRVEPDDRGELLLAAEPAAGLGLDDARRVVVETQAALERAVQVVRALERARDGDAAAVGRLGDHRVVLDVQLLLVADPVLALEDDVGARHRGVDVARSRSRRSRRCARTRSGSKTPGSRVVRGRGAAARLAQRRPVRRGQERERLGVVLDLATDRDEDRLVALDGADDVLARDVGGGDDDDLRPVERGIELERVERGVGVGRADRRAVPRPGDDDVVRVEGDPGQLGRSLATQRDRPGARDRGRSWRAGRRGRRGRRSGSSWGRSTPPWRFDDTTASGPRNGGRDGPWPWMAASPGRLHRSARHPSGRPSSVPGGNGNWSQRDLRTVPMAGSDGYSRGPLARSSSWSHPDHGTVAGRSCCRSCS